MVEDIAGKFSLRVDFSVSGCTNSSILTKKFVDMDNFDAWDDDEDYGDLFITQTPKEVPMVSLEDDNEVEFKTIRDPQYSDISDEDEDAMRDVRIR